MGSRSEQRVFRRIKMAKECLLECVPHPLQLETFKLKLILDFIVYPSGGSREHLITATVEDVGKEACASLPVGLQTGTATVETDVVNSQRAERSTIWSSCSICPKYSTSSCTDICSAVFITTQCTMIENGSHLKCHSTDEWIKTSFLLWQLQHNEQILKGDYYIFSLLLSIEHIKNFTDSHYKNMRSLVNLIPKTGPDYKFPVVTMTLLAWNTPSLGPAFKRLHDGEHLMSRVTLWCHYSDLQGRGEYCFPHFLASYQ